LKTSNGRVSTKGKGKVRPADEDLHSNEGGSEALDYLDLRADEVDPNESGAEDAGETPAEKRLRLAKLYLESVKESLGTSLPTRFVLLWHSHSGCSIQ
jgi:ribosomal RNA-processing protein 9